MSKETTAKIVAQMRAQGNQPGLVRILKMEIARWAMKNPRHRHADGVTAWLPYLKPRKFYTAAELVPLFPVLALTMGFEPILMPQKSSARLSNELKFANLPVLKNANGTQTFLHPLQHRHPLQEFFICERMHFWRDQELTQEQFEAEIFK
jgi:hypothetical protein